MKGNELLDAVRELRRSVDALADLVREQNELSRKALLLEQRRQLIQHSGLISEAEPLTRSTSLEMKTPPGASDGTV